MYSAARCNDAKTRIMSLLSRFWGWLSDADNRAKLTLIGGGLVGLATVVTPIYLHFAPSPPAPVVNPITPSPVDPEALKRLSDSEKRALDAETCALDNVARQISGLAPLSCPAPGPSR